MGVCPEVSGTSECINPLGYSLFSYSKSDNSHRNQCSHTSVIPCVLASGGLAVIGCSVTPRLLRDCLDLSIMCLCVFFLCFLGRAPRGALWALCASSAFCCGALGDLAPFLAQAQALGLVPCVSGQTTYPLQVICGHTPPGPSQPSFRSDSSTLSLNRSKSISSSGTSRENVASSGSKETIVRAL